MKKSLFGILAIVIILIIILASAYKKKSQSQDYNFKGDNMKITSLAFSQGQSIPAKYTCKGENINPELVFEQIPPEAKSLALIMDDPDAPGATFTHWVVYNMPPETMRLAENSNPPGVQAKNSADENKYIGPCPPSGTHRYFFKLYALDAMLSASKISTKEDLLSATQGHILEETELMGKFTK